jgi:hypothetical protein
MTLPKAARFGSLLIAFAAAQLACSIAEPPSEQADDDLLGADASAFLAAHRQLKDVDRVLKVADEDTLGLYRVLGKIGPMLTPSQQAAYAEAYYRRPAMMANLAATHTQAAEAARAVDRLVANKPLFSKIMSGSYVGIVATKTDLYDAYKTLARTGSNASACAFGGAILDGAPGYESLAERRPDVEADIVVPACTGVFVAALARGKEPLLALDELRDFGANIGSIANGAKTAVEPGVFKAFGEYSRLFSALSTAAKIARAGYDIAGGRYQKGLTELTVDSPQIVLGVRDAISAYRVVVRGDSALKSVSVATGRLAGGFSVLTSAYAIAQDLQDIDDTSDKARLAADCISLSGSLLIVLGAATVGAPVLALGTSVLFASKFLKTRELSAAEQRDREELLPQLGLGLNTLQTLLSPNTKAIASLASFGLSATQLQALAEKIPTLLSSKTNVQLSFTNFIKLAGGLAWSPETTVGMFDAMIDCPLDQRARQAFLPVAWTELGALNGAPGASKTRVIATIDRNLPSSRGSDPGYDRAVETFRRYVETH